MTLEQFAGTLGEISKQSLSKYEVNRNEPTIALLAKIAELGSVTVDWIVRGGDMNYSQTGASIDSVLEENRQLRRKCDQLTGQINRLEGRLESEKEHCKMLLDLTRKQSK